MAKMYFLKGSEDVCFTLEHWKDHLAFNKLKEIELFEAKRITGNGHFFCKQFQEMGEVSEGGCGNTCDKYKPNNGKGGRCKHYGYCYEVLRDKVIVLRAKQ